jgi:hypothetical protein
MTLRSHFPTGSVPGLDLTADEYTVTPAERSRDPDEEVADILTGDAGLGDSQHHFDVTGPEDAVRLEVVEEFGSGLVDRFGSGDGEFSGATYRHFLFRSPAGESHLVLHRGGFATRYALRPAATGTLLATWSKSWGFLGDWELADPGGTTRATLEKDRSVGGLVPVSRHGSYVVRSTDGTDVARFERTRLGSGFTELALTELTVTVDPSAIPPEICLALGVGVLVEAWQSGGPSHGAGGGSS